MPNRYDLDRDAIAEVLGGEPRYRVDQVWAGLYQRHRHPEELTELPKALRARLAERLPSGLDVVTERVTDGGDTVKLLCRLEGGDTVETVVMTYRDRTTVCVSTQAGCAMGCGFCATGQAGFDRHLTAGEIVAQVIEAQRRTPILRGTGRVGNVVFMGMGEPMANYDAMWAAVERLHDDVGISARHLTVSTVGIVPGIRRLAGERLPVNLAVSLHAANDELRNRLVPMNRRYPLTTLVQACHEYFTAKRRRVSFEWALIDGTNDRERDAAELAALARPLHAHVNLIPLNPTPGWPTRGSDPTQVRAFRGWLRAAGVNATVRRNRGTDIDAACGQLRAVSSVHGAVSEQPLSEPARSPGRQS